MTGARNVAVADVYKRGRLAGRFATEGNRLRWSYDAAYDGPPVGHSLPFGEVVETPGRVLPAWFSNLLPEGRRLNALLRQVKTSADDELSLLLALGDTVGDVDVGPSGQTVAAPQPLLDAVDLTSTSFAEVLRSHHFVDRVGLAGAQDKVSAGMITVPVVTGAGASLVKLNPPDYPFAVENEAYFLTLARRLGLPVAAATTVRDRDGQPGLLVQRFDRPLQGGETQRRAVEDGCQVMDRYPGDKYLMTGEEVAASLAGACAARLVAVRALMLQFCFAWLTGNGDLHAKNLSIIESATGEWAISPMYDLPSTLPYGDTTMALSLGGRDDGFRRRHLVAAGVALGLPVRAAEKVVSDALHATGPLLGDLERGALPFDAHLTRTLVRVLGRRRRDLSEG